MRAKKQKNKKRQKGLVKLFLGCFLIILIGLILLQIHLDRNSVRKIGEARPTECQRDSDCIIVRKGCCSCEEGGAPQCIAKSKLGGHAKTFENCSLREVCFGLDCGRINCGCVNKKCVGSPA